MNLGQAFKDVKAKLQAKEGYYYVDGR